MWNRQYAKYFPDIRAHVYIQVILFKFLQDLSQETLNSQELFQDGNYPGHELENMQEQHLNSDNIKAICKLVVYIFLIIELMLTL